MSLQRKILTIAVLVASMSSGLQAQGKYEINIGISNAGYYSLADRDILFGFSGEYAGMGIGGDYSYYDDWRESELKFWEEMTYNSTLYPSISIEMSYKLADSGFTKHLSLVGYAGFHVVGYERYNFVTNNWNDKRMAKRVDFLLGFRINYMRNRYFNMYSQFLLGYDWRDNCEYWTITDDYLRDGMRMSFQFTFIGVTAKIGSNLNILTELGYGTEYCLSYVPLLPGFRVGIGYNFK